MAAGRCYHPGPEGEPIQARPPPVPGDQRWTTREPRPQTTGPQATGRPAFARRSWPSATPPFGWRWPTSSWPRPKPPRSATRSPASPASSVWPSSSSCSRSTSSSSGRHFSSAIGSWLHRLGIPARNLLLHRSPWPASCWPSASPATSSPQRRPSACSSPSSSGSCRPRCSTSCTRRSPATFALASTQSTTARRSGCSSASSSASSSGRRCGPGRQLRRFAALVVVAGGVFRGRHQHFTAIAFPYQIGIGVAIRHRLRDLDRPDRHRCLATSIDVEGLPVPFVRPDGSRPARRRWSRLQQRSRPDQTSGARRTHPRAAAAARRRLRRGGGHPAPRSDAARPRRRRRSAASEALALKDHGASSVSAAGHPRAELRPLPGRCPRQDEKTLRTGQ